MRKIFSLSVLLATLIVTGCTTPTLPVAMDQSFFEKKEAKVGVMLFTPEKTDFYLMGDIRLLDLAIVSAATSGLNKHVESIGLDDLKTLDDDLHTRLSDAGFSSEIIELNADKSKKRKLKKFRDPNKKDNIRFAKYDYRDMQKEHNIDYLIKVSVLKAGVERSYHGFVPLTDPVAVIEMDGDLVDLQDNKLLWSRKIRYTNQAQGHWDEAPTFPGLTNSYFVSLEQAREYLLKEFTHADTSEKEQDFAAKEPDTSSGESATLPQ